MTMDRFIREITKKAGVAVLKRFGKDGALYLKTRNRLSVVTKADLLAEKIIISAIRKRYPDHGIISEESAHHRPDAEYVWIIDPIDGTLNFATGIPLFGTMVALAHRGTVILSAIHLPVTDELFFAKKGKGAYVNGKRIHCSRHREWATSTGVGPSGLRERAIKFVGKLLTEVKGKRIVYCTYGCMAVDAAYIASGRRDWYVVVSGQTHDYAPIVLLMQEAGCKVTNLRGELWSLRDTEAVAANPTLHKQILKLTKNV